MARKTRIVWELGLYHVTTRGNNKKQVFIEEADFRKYLAMLKDCKDRFKFLLYAYTLMPNHPHPIIETTKYGSISKIMKYLNHRYAVWHNAKYGQSGHLWQGRFHSNIIDKDSYLLKVIRYIELNPVRGKLVTNPKDYKWSSYRFHALNEESLILDKHPIFETLGNSPEEIGNNYTEFVMDELVGTDYPIEKVPDTNVVSNRC